MKNFSKFKLERIYRKLLERKLSEFFDRFLSGIFGYKISFLILFTIFRLRAVFAKIIRFCEFGPGLWLNSRNLKSHYYEIIYVDPNSIEYVIKDGNVPFIQAGDWDLRKRPFELHRSIIEIYEEKKTFQETQQYKHMQQRIKKGLPAYWCKKAQDVDEYFKILMNACEDIKKGKYKLQPINEKSIYPDEILVSICRDGSLLHERNGSHRLSAAKYFGLNKVPVVVIRRHAKVFNKNQIRCFYNITI
jgi:hypothetical protein